MTLRCGKIRYTNALPLYAAFESGAVPFPGSLYAGVPARLNAMLLEGSLDLSPMSAFAWARHADELVLLPDVCIGARNAVMSVVLASPLPPERLDGANVFVTPDSESGFNLLRVLLERRYGVRPSYVREANCLERARAGEPAMIIGDAAIDALEMIAPQHVYDLGRLWHEWTAQDCVFAVWCARRDAYDRDPDGIWACMRAFTGALAWSMAHPDAIVARAQQTIARSDSFYHRYYRSLNFAFDDAAQAGLAAFVRELAAIDAIAELAPVRPLEPYAAAR